MDRSYRHSRFGIQFIPKARGGWHSGFAGQEAAVEIQQPGGGIGKGEGQSGLAAGGPLGDQLAQRSFGSEKGDGLKGGWREWNVPGGEAGQQREVDAGGQRGGEGFPVAGGDIHDVNATVARVFPGVQMGDAVPPEGAEEFFRSGKDGRMRQEAQGGVHGVGIAARVMAGLDGVGEDFAVPAEDAAIHVAAGHEGLDDVRTRGNGREGGQQGVRGFKPADAQAGSAGHRLEQDGKGQAGNFGPGGCHGGEQQGGDRGQAEGGKLFREDKFIGDGGQLFGGGQGWKADAGGECDPAAGQQVQTKFAHGQHDFRAGGPAGLIQLFGGVAAG